MVDSPKEPTHKINLDFSGTGKFSGKVSHLARIRNTRWYLVSWALMIVSAGLGFFFDPVTGAVVGLVLGVVGIYISPMGEKIVERVREF